MTSTNDGKDVKSNQTSGQKGKSYYIELYKSLDGRLSGECGLEDRTQHLCEAWRRVHSLCLHSAPATHPHLLSWLQRHTARTILQTKWSKEEQDSLDEAINAFIEETKSGRACKDGVSPPWETQLLQRGQWFKRVLSNPWGHPVLRVLLDPKEKQPADDEILEWLKEERGVMFVTRLRQLATSKCADLAVTLVTAVMDRVRACTHLVPDAEQSEEPKDKPKQSHEKPTFADILTSEAGFTVDVWELLTDIEFVLLHKGDSRSKCIELAKQTPLRNGYQLVERLQGRLETSPREKKLWKNAKEVATLIAQVVIARCMVVPVCSNVSRTALYCCTRSLVRLLPAGKLESAANALAAPAATARHLHTLAAATLAQCASDMKPFVCELYVRAITAGMNELERLKLNKEKEGEARLQEQTLSSWFTQLGNLLSHNPRLRYECTLTAFSVHPSPAMYVCIQQAPALPARAVEQDIKEETTSEFGSWATDSRAQTNLVKTSETLNLKQTQRQANVLSTAILTEGEALGLSPELCQDLAVLLSGPRVKTLSWDMDRELLLENCRTYMERTHGGTRALTTELKFLNLDPRCYQHLPEEDDAENDAFYGIEKGYEHLVEVQDQEEIWQDAFSDPERPDSFSSSNSDIVIATAMKKRKKKKQRHSSSGEDSDPLSLVAEAQRSEKKKERPHSKERSKERKETKRKSKSKDGSEKKETSRERRKDPLDPKEKKERKPRKKKESMLMPSVECKPGSLSSLIGMKVSKVKIPEGRYKKNSDMRVSAPYVTDSDYDSQGKSSLASLNSEGNDPDVLFDGLYNMEDYKSPEKGDPLAVRNTFTNSELSVANGRVAINTASTLNKFKLQNSQSLSNKTQNLNTSNNAAIREEVKKSITRLIEFRRQKSLLEETQIFKSSGYSPAKSYSDNSASPKSSPIVKTSDNSAPIIKSPNAIVRHEFPEPAVISPKAVEVPEIPKAYINKKPEFSKDKQEFDMLKYSKNSAIYTNKSTPQPSHEHYQPYVQPKQQNYQQRYSNFENVPQTPSVSVIHNKLDESEKKLQKNFEDFLRDLQESINAGTGANKKGNAPKTVPEKKEVKPISRVTPVIPNFPKTEPGISTQCAKSIIQSTKRVDNQLNTFARLSYMHKNKQGDMKINKHSDMSNQDSQHILSRCIEEQKTAKLKYLQSKGDISIRCGQTHVSPKEETHVGIRKVEKATPTVIEHPMLSNMLQGSYSSAKPQTKIETPVRNYSYQQEKPGPKDTALSEKDQNDLLLLLRQQSKLNSPANYMSSDVNKIVHNPQYATSTATSNTSSVNQASSVNKSVIRHQSEFKSNIQQYEGCRVKTVRYDSPLDNHTKAIETAKVSKPITSKKLNITLSKVSNMTPCINQDAKNTIQMADSIDNASPNSVGKITSKITMCGPTKKGSKNKSADCRPDPSTKVKSEPQDWESVMDALLSHKTPSLGPNALDVALKKDSYAKTALRNQRIVRKKERRCYENKHEIPPRTFEPEQTVVTDLSTKNVEKIETTQPVRTEQPKRTAETQKHIPCPVIKEKDPFISGIPNSDYDLLEELMDDELRKEIGELSSDEDLYRAPTASSTKVIKATTTSKCSNVIKNTSHHDTQTTDLRGGSSTNVQNARGTIIQTNKRAVTKTIDGTKSLLNKPTVQAVNTANVRQNKVDNKPKILENIKLPCSKTQVPVSNVKIQPPITENQTYNITPNINKSGVNLLDARNMIITATPQPVAPKVVLIGSEVIYDPYASIQTPIQTGICSVNPTPYVAVNTARNVTLNTAPNITVYQTTQFAAPVVNPVIIGSAMTMPVPDMIPENTQVIHTEQSHEISSSQFESAKPSEYTLGSNVRLENTRSSLSEAELLKETMDKLNYDFNQATQKHVESEFNMTTNLDINFNNNGERKVLSEVQDKQTVNLTGNVDFKMTRNQNHLAESELKKEIARDQEKQQTEFKTQKQPIIIEQMTRRVKSEDRERIMMKRLAILDRNTLHRSTRPAIPLGYVPLKSKQISIDAINQDTTLPCDESIPNNTINTDNELNNKVVTKQDTPNNDSSKENDIKTTCRRILLRSSNDLKAMTVTSNLDQRNPVGRKTKVRLKFVSKPENNVTQKSNEEEIVEKIDTVSPKRVSKRILNKKENSSKQVEVVDDSAIPVMNISNKRVLKVLKVTKPLSDATEDAKDTLTQEQNDNTVVGPGTIIPLPYPMETKSLVNETSNVTRDDFGLLDIEDALLGSKIPKKTNVESAEEAPKNDALESEGKDVRPKSARKKRKPRKFSEASEVSESENVNASIDNSTETNNTAESDVKPSVDKNTCESTPGKSPSKTGVTISIFRNKKGSGKPRFGIKVFDAGAIQEPEKGRPKRVKHVKELEPVKVLPNQDEKSLEIPNKETVEDLPNLSKAIESKINPGISILRPARVKKIIKQVIPLPSTTKDEILKLDENNVIETSKEVLPISNSTADISNQSIDSPSDNVQSVIMISDKDKIVKPQSAIPNRRSLLKSSVINNTEMSSKTASTVPPIQETSEPKRIPGAEPKTTTKNAESVPPSLDSKTESRTRKLPTILKSKTAKIEESPALTINTSTQKPISGLASPKIVTNKVINHLSPKSRKEVVQPITSMDKTPSQAKDDDHDSFADLKEKISIEELPSPLGDPTKKCVRIKLPNGKTFKATVFGKMHVSFESIFSDPALKSTLLNNIHDTKRYTVNIKQVSTSAKDNPKKIVETRIEEVNVHTREAKPIETVNLLSDDDEEPDNTKKTYTFRTEFGEFKTQDVDEADLKNHQMKLDQKCSVDLVKLKDSEVSFSKETISEPLSCEPENANVEDIKVLDNIGNSTPDFGDELIDLPSVTLKNTPDIEVAQISPDLNIDNKDNIKMLDTPKVIPDVIEIDDSSNDSVDIVKSSNVVDTDVLSKEIAKILQQPPIETPIILKESSQKPVEEIDELKKLLLKDLGVEVASKENQELVADPIEELIVIDNDEPPVETKECFVRLENCDELVEEYDKKRIMNQKCIVDLVRCDGFIPNTEIVNANDSPEENDFNENSDDFIDLDVADVSLNPSSEPRSRSGSFSLLGEFAVYNDDKEISIEHDRTSPVMSVYDTIAALRKPKITLLDSPQLDETLSDIFEYDRSSPVMEVYETIAACRRRTESAPINNTQRLQCCCDWYRTKRDLHSDSLMNTIACTLVYESVVETSINTISKLEVDEIVPSLKTLTVKLFQSDEILSRLRPYSLVLKKEAIQSPTHKLKRKLRNGEEKGVASKILKVVMNIMPKDENCGTEFILEKNNSDQSVETVFSDIHKPIEDSNDMKSKAVNITLTSLCLKQLNQSNEQYYPTTARNNSIEDDNSIEKEEIEVKSATTECDIKFNALSDTDLSTNCMQTESLTGESFDNSNVVESCDTMNVVLKTVEEVAKPETASSDIQLTDDAEKVDSQNVADTPNDSSAEIECKENIVTELSNDDSELDDKKADQIQNDVETTTNVLTPDENIESKPQIEEAEEESYTQHRENPDMTRTPADEPFKPIASDITYSSVETITSDEETSKTSVSEEILNQKTETEDHSDENVNQEIGIKNIDEVLETTSGTTEQKYDKVEVISEIKDSTGIDVIDLKTSSEKQEEDSNKSVQMQNIEEISQVSETTCEVTLNSDDKTILDSEDPDKMLNDPKEPSEELQTVCSETTVPKTDNDNQQSVKDITIKTDMNEEVQDEVSKTELEDETVLQHSPETPEIKNDVNVSKDETANLHTDNDSQQTDCQENILDPDDKHEAETTSNIPSDTILESNDSFKCTSNSDKIENDKIDSQIISEDHNEQTDNTKNQLLDLEICVTVDRDCSNEAKQMKRDDQNSELTDKSDINKENCQEIVHDVGNLQDFKQNVNIDDKIRSKDTDDHSEITYVIDVEVSKIQDEKDLEITKDQTPNSPEDTTRNEDDKTVNESEKENELTEQTSSQENPSLSFEYQLEVEHQSDDSNSCFADIKSATDSVVLNVAREVEITSDSDTNISTDKQTSCNKLSSVSTETTPQEQAPTKAKGENLDTYSENKNESKTECVCYKIRSVQMLDHGYAFKDFCFEGECKTIKKTSDSESCEPSPINKRNEVVLNGIEYEDPEIGTCYVFPIAESPTDCETDCDLYNDTTEEIIQVIQEIGEDGTVGNVTLETKEVPIEEPYFKVNIPKMTYSKNNIYHRKDHKYATRSLKRKSDMTDIRSGKKYRKSKNIDYPKVKPTYISDAACSKDFKSVFDYCSSLKFSYSQPFHKEFIDVEEIIKDWPLKGEYCSDFQDEIDSNDLLFTDLDIQQYGISFGPLEQTLAEELTAEYSETDSSSSSTTETNFNMGFGEGSDRVIQNLEDVGDDSKFSAATLSDVKQPQPFLLSENYKDDQVKQLKRYITYMQMRDKVRSFFKRTTVELKYDWMKKQDKYKTSVLSDGRELTSFPFELYNTTDFIEPPPVDLVVQVVQVGQLPVSAAAQNPVTCDPRVTQVSDASPSQCSVENSPQDDSQPAIKTEYTELTTADLTLPLVQEYVQHNQLAMESQEQSNMPMTGENIPIETEIKSVVKIELMEETEVKEEVGETYENNDSPNMENKYVNNIDYGFDTNTANANIVESEQDFQALYNSNEKQNIAETYATQQPKQNGTPEKTDQIAHAMNAAGITTTSETMTNTTRAHALVNILNQKIRQGQATQSTANNYTKTTSINAMSLQQALAQILPPPLNQTTSNENSQQNQNTSVAPQVLHIVQGKNASGSQITLVDNSQQSVINGPNTTPVLHIVQNKSGTTGATSNGAATQQTNSFGGLSLVDAGLQQGGNQLLHIVNAGNQKNSNAGQLLKRVNLLTNLANVQGSNEQKMVQFVCKSADGKAIQLNAPHQRSMVLRLQPIETPNVQSTPKSENQELSPTANTTNTLAGKDSAASQQEIKSRSVYEENYAKFIQNSSNKTTVNEKSTSLPKFNQAFGKPVFQDGTQKQNDINSNNSHITVNTNSEGSECQSSDNAINLDHIGQISSPPLLLRKSPAQTSQPQANLVQQIKQTITPMNIQTMHGGVIYTRQIPVNIGGGQTINLITVPSTELVDENGQKQQPVGNQNDMEQSIIKIVPQNQTGSNNEISSEDGNAQINVSNESNQNPQPQPQPVLTQMRIKLPMLSKTPQMVSGARVVRPSFFQIQRNVIGGANQPVYQQLVLTAAPPLGQQTIRLPQTQTSRQIKVPTENQSSAESQMSSSTLEQLREFDMVLEQVKERSSVPPNSNSSSTTFPKLHTPSTDTTDGSSASSTSTETTQQVLYSIGNNHQPLNVAYVNRKASVAPPTTSTYVRSPDSSGIVDSPTSSSHVQIPHTVTTESSHSEPSTQPKPKVSSKSKSRPKASSNPPSSLKINTVPPKTSAQKPLEDEQTTQRILYILAEYKEQVENSPDKDKPAPRRRSNPPSNPSGSSKRKKSSSGSRRHGRDMSPIHGEDTCRTMGSEDSSCGTSQGDCNESCLESHSPQDSPRKVVRKLTFENETPPPQPRPQTQRNVIVADGQTITVARGTAGKPATAVLMPANYILPVSMVKGGQQIAIVTNRGPKLLTVGGGEGGATNALLLQRLIGPAGLKPVLTRPGVRHVRLPTAALHNLQAFNLATATTIQPPDSTASPAPAPTPPELVDTRATSSPWTDRDQDVKPERGSSPEGSEPWNLPSSGDPHDYTYEETVRADNLDRTVLDPIPDRYSPDMEAQRIFDKMFDVESKKSYLGDSPRCVYDIDASDCDDKPYHQVVQKKDGHRQHRLTHVSAAALRHKYAILEHELRLQKSLSEECEDLGVDSPSASELFPEAELLFAASPAHDHTQDHGHHSHTPQPTLLNQSCIPQPDIDDQIATDQLLSRGELQDDQQDLQLGLEDVGMVGAGLPTALDAEEFARAHPNTTFHSEPTDEGEVQPFTIAGLKGRHITSTIFHSNRAPATVLMTAPQTTVISQATADVAGHNVVKYDIDNMINSLPSNGNNINLSSVLVKDEGLTRFDSILNDSRELHLSNTASAIVHSAGNATQVIRRVCYEDDKRDNRFLMDESDALIAGDDAKMIAEDSSRDATLESMAGDDDRSSPERHAELFWESNSASERSESRRPLDFSSDSEKCCKSPSYDETNSTDSSGVGAHMRLDTVIKDARGIERSGSADGSSADDTHPPLRTYPPKRMYHPLDGEVERSLSGKTRAGERSPDSLEVRRRASGRGVVKRGCHCCSGSPAPPRPKKSRKKPTMDFNAN